MVCMPLKASAPGSFVVSGEHAVLQGKQAVVAAIASRINVTLTQRHDEKITIHSSLGQYETQLSTIKIEKPFQYVLAAIHLFLKELKTGFSLEIHSDFSHTLGLGSSAAVTVACAAVLIQFTQQALSLEAIYKKAKAAILLVQPQASCADVAASVFGGLLAYTMAPLRITPIASDPRFHLIYLGYKTATPIVVAQVQSAVKQSPDFFQAIFEAIHCCSQAIAAALEKTDWVEVGQWFTRHQGLQQALGVSCAISEEILLRLRCLPTIYGAKISGSGLGDCILALGDLPAGTFPQDARQEKKGIKQFSFAIADKGVHIVE